MRVSEAKLKELQAKGAIVKREPKPAPVPAPPPPDDPKEASLEQMANASLSQVGLLNEIASQLKHSNEIRTESVRLVVNRDKKGLIQTIDIVRM